MMIAVALWAISAALVVALVHNRRLARDLAECRGALVHVLMVMRADPDLTEYMTEQLAKAVDEHGPHGSC